MNDITALAQREKFEAWAEEFGALPWGILKKHRNQDGSYPGPHYSEMWKAWQAASKEMVEALEAKDIEAGWMRNRISELAKAHEESEERRVKWFKMAQELGEKLDAADKRNTELVEALEKAQDSGKVFQQAFFRQSLMYDVVAEAYEEAKEQIAKDVEIKARLCRESNSLFDRLRAAEKRIAELEREKVVHESVAMALRDDMRESRTVTVKLPEGYSIRPGHPINEGERGVMIPKDGGTWLSRFDVEHALQAAGIQVIEGEQKNG